MTDKSNGKMLKVKARLVCHGFEEAIKVQVDSLTGNKETLHLLLSIAATKGWKIKSGDVKNTYLQGEELNREVFMEPPQEAKNDRINWKLRKSIYRMNDAGRRWFLKVEVTLASLGCAQSKLDHCLFHFKSDNKLDGILVIWVDDLFYAGNKIFEENVINKFGEEFMIGRTEEELFTYIGLLIETTKQGITVSQEDYIKGKLSPAELNGGKNSRPLDKEESKPLRKLTGQINWVATQSRPDVSYSVMELSSKFNKVCLEDLKKANRVIINVVVKPCESPISKNQRKSRSRNLQ